MDLADIEHPGCAVAASRSAGCVALSFSSECEPMVSATQYISQKSRRRSEHGGVGSGAGPWAVHGLLLDCLVGDRSGLWGPVSAVVWVVVIPRVVGVAVVPGVVWVVVVPGVWVAVVAGVVGVVVVSRVGRVVWGVVPRVVWVGVEVGVSVRWVIVVSGVVVWGVQVGVGEQTHLLLLSNQIN